MYALAITLAAFLAIAIAGLALSVRITLRDRERNADQQTRDTQTIKDLTARLATRPATETDSRVVMLYAQGTLSPYELRQTSYIDQGEQLVEKLNRELFDTLKNSGLIETLLSDEHLRGKTVTQRIAIIPPERNKTP